MKKDVLAVIITYNPNIERLRKNIHFVSPQIDYLLIVDNCSVNLNDIESLTKSIDENKLGLILNDRNEGIAKALNQALFYASKNGYKYLFTLDQDSVCSENLVEQLKKTLDLDDTIAIVGPQINDINKDENIKLRNEVVFTTSLITSGNLCDVKKIDVVGGYDEKLFIDCVDHEICWRLRSNSYKIAINMNTVLNHEIGKRTKKSFLFKNIYVLNHNEKRVYYMARNRIYILKKYRYLKEVNVLKELWGFTRRVIWIVLYEKDKSKKIKMTVKGIFDGLRL